MSRACPSCGADARSAARFCRRCGGSLRDGDVVELDEPTPPDAWSLTRPVIALVALVLLASSILWIVLRLRPELAPQSDIAASAFVLVLAAAFAATERSAIRELLVLPRFEGRELARTLLVVVVGALAVSAYFAFLFRVLRLQQLTYLDGWSSAGWPPWGAVVVVCVAAPVTEELLFRGYVQARLTRVMGHARRHRGASRHLRGRALLALDVPQSLRARPRARRGAPRVAQPASEHAAARRMERCRGRERAPLRRCVRALDAQ